MAVASIRTTVDQQSINAENVLEELTATFFSSTFATLDVALARAIDSSLAAAAPRSQADRAGIELGLAIVAIEGERVLIAVKPPCLAVMRQESEIYLLPARPVGKRAPEISTALPGDVELFETNLSNGDHIGLLAAMEPGGNHAYLSESLAAGDLEDAAGPNGAYVWLEVADDESPAPAEPLEVSASTTPARPTPPSAAVPHVSVWGQPLSRGPGLFNRPPGADALRRYRSTRGHGMPSSLRSRLPRGTPSLRAVMLVVVAVALIAAAGVVAESRRPTPNYPVGASVDEYAVAVASAIEAGDDELVAALLPGAQQLLDNAQRAGAGDEEVANLRLQIVAASDYLDGTVRLQDPRRVGIVPESLRSQSLRLVEAAGTLYLVAGDIFAIDGEHRQLIAMSELESGAAAGTLENGAGDISTLVLASDEVAIFNGDATGGMLEIPASWPVGFGLDDAFASVFQGRLYLLDRQTADIVMVDPMSGATTEWLSPDSPPLPEEPAGMVVDGGIQVLYPNGEIYSLYEGYVTDTVTVDILPAIDEAMAISLGGVSNLWYIADYVDNEGRLTVYDMENRAAADYVLGPDELGRLDTEMHRSFASMTDLLVSESTDSMYWIADGAIWTADFGDQDVFAEEESDAGQET